MSRVCLYGPKPFIPLAGPVCSGGRRCSPCHKNNLVRLEVPDFRNSANNSAILFWALFLLWGVRVSEVRNLPDLLFLIQARPHAGLLTAEPRPVAPSGRFFSSVTRHEYLHHRLCNHAEFPTCPDKTFVLRKTCCCQLLLLFWGLN